MKFIVHRFLSAILLIAAAGSCQASLVAAEYYVGSDPGEGHATAVAFSSDDGLSRELENAVIALNRAPGTYEVGLRVKDDAGRWSNPSIRRFTLVAGDFALAGGIDPNAPDSGTGTSSPKLVEPLSQAEYYVGTDPGTGNGTAMTFASDDELSRDLESAVIALDMPAGTYDVGLRVKDASGRWSNAAIRRFTLVAGDFALAGGIDPSAPDAGAGTSSPKLVEPLSQAEYYVGTDPGTGNGTAMTFASDDELSRDLESAVIALNMPAGTYDVGLRVKDTSGRWSNAAIRRFTLVAGNFTLAGGIDPNAPDAGTGTSTPKLVEPLSQAEYYVGTDPGVGNGTAMTFASDDELSRDLESAVIALNMPAGTYDVGLRVKDASGRWSNAAIRRFTLVAGGFTLAGGIDPNAPDAGTGTGTSSPKLVEPLSQAEYYVGTDPGAGNGTAMTFASDDELSRDLESAVIALNMPAGTYDVGLRVKDASGRWSNAAIRRFTLVAGNFTLAGGIDPNAPDAGTGTSSPKMVEPLSQAEYYVGSDPGAGNGTALNFTSDDELSRELESAVIALNMDSGTYDVGLRVKDSANRWSNVAIRRFTMVAFPPSIIDQPVNVTATEDGSASFSVTCTSPSAHYQWQKDGVDLAGATESTLILSPVQAASAGIYTVLVSNSAGSELSSGATLTVNCHPVISEPPASLAATEGETATFSVTASNPYAGALSYQWQKNGVDLAGATLATLVLDPVQMADAGDYTVVVSNSVASLTSLAATLTITPASHDSDGDGLDDSVETNTGVCVSSTDTGTHPNLADSDGDGVPDGLEVKEKTSPVDATQFNSFSKGLVAYWPLDGTTHDESGQGHNATLTGLSSYVPNHLGKDNSALKFSDTEQHAVGEGFNLSGSSMSIACWYKKSFDPIDSWIFRLGSESASGKSVHVALDYPNDIRFSFFYNDFDYQSSPIQSIDRWYHLVVTYDSSSHERKIFVNGIQVASGFAPEAFTGNGDFGFGCNGVTMDELRVFDRALSSIEVTSLYQSEAPKMPRFELVNGSYTWQEAKADAESRGGRLAVLDTEEKQLDAALLLPNSSGYEYFIGATDEAVEGAWKWVDGSAISYSDWGGGEPNGDDYLSITTGGWGGIGFAQWNDTFLNPSGNNRGYLLEMPGDSVWLPQITVPPVAVTAAQGSNVTLSVTATGTTLQYQWRKDGIDIAGATQSTLTLNPAETSDSARYTVVVSNAAGSVTSGEALATVLIPPAIEVQPVGADAYLGDFVTLAVAATGSRLNYQWQKNGGNLEGATAATLALGSVQASDAASYTVVISNALGSVTSSAAMVTAVADLRDSDGDGLTNYDEVFVYGTSPNSADTDGDGLSDPYELGLGRYSVVLGSFTWQQAEADAVAKGGTLATFANQGEWLWAQESIGADALYDVTGLWIGATDSAVEGTWLWITGEPVTYSHWAVGEPNNGNNSDHAAIAGDLGGETGDWYDYRATTKRDGYILETGYATDPTVADADHDGLSDGEEQTAGTNPFLADTDDDGLSDGIEVKQTHTNPQLADSNGNGIADLLEDTDGDGLSNQEELALGTNPGMTDSDGDGLLDLEELGRNRFSLVQGAFTYATATANAAALGGHLATFTDAAELAEAMREIGGTALDNLSGSWIGATDVAVEGEWRWVTGEALAFSPWAVGKPNNIYNADYAAMVGGKNGGVVGKWADFSATALLDSYLLEKGFVTNPAVADTDGDGANDGEETEWGSDPEDVSKLPEWKVTIDRIQDSSDRIRLRFPTLVGASYRVEVSPDLNTWQALTVDILGDGNLKTHEVIRGGATQQFFRVKQN